MKVRDMRFQTCYINNSVRTVSNTCPWSISGLCAYTPSRTDVVPCFDRNNIAIGIL